MRPYRVGMACGFCHVGPSPIAPPADPENPRWSELSTTTGNQYLRPGRIFANLLEDDDFVWHAFNAMPPGTVDTSLLATDNVLNPRVMNAIHDLPARLSVAHEEELAGGNLALPGTSPRMAVPHVLKDGADSVGVAGALARVYLSIGAFHQEWLRHFRVLVGGTPQTPFPVAGAAERSAYWAATLDRLDNLAKFFLRVTADRRGHHHLEDAPGGARYLATDPDQLRRGKIVFAEHCAGCHSSKRPPAELQHGTEAFDAWMRRSVLAPDFRDHNFLSNERRNPVTKIGTNACSPLASNAMRGHVWNDFSSETYKTLPAVDPIEVDNPFTGETETVEMPGGGRGYIRTPSLVGIWATAPYLQNNSVGRFTADPSVEGRMEAFDDGIRKMLWPERREDDTCRKEWGMPFCGPIYRTTRESELVVRAAFLPEPLRRLLADEMEDGALHIGPIPEGTPVALLADLDTTPSIGNAKTFAKILIDLHRSLKTIDQEGLGPDAARDELKKLVPALRSLSTCLDYKVDRGHLFGADLPDADKEDLIPFLKTL